MPFSMRRLLLGSPIATSRSAHERLPKVLALPIFASDALSSVAYATQEIIHTFFLLHVGLAAFQYTPWVAASIVVLLLIVATSYSQTIFAYPGGGGAYVVARDNLGPVAAQTAGAALATDYILTVAVSVAAGVDAIISTQAANPAAFDQISGLRVPLCVLAVLLVTIANLRGVRESGLLFALPTYAFIAVVAALLGWGFAKLVGWAPGGLIPAPHAEMVEPGTQAVTAVIMLKAFASGCAALTGVEAISNGVTAFRKPEARNAVATMWWMAGILAVVFLGVTSLAVHLQTHYEVGGETVISQVGRGVFGGGFLYFALQGATALILLLAANTAFAGFPRLCALQAQDGFLPRQLTNVGDRLVFSNGIVALAVIASLVIVLFRGQTHYLIPLYAVGVFLSFTLSQAGMVRRWCRLRTPRWWLNALVNGVGAVATLVVMVVIAYSKWTSGEKFHIGTLTIPTGAYLVVIIVPVLVYIFFLIYNHYRSLARQLTLEGYNRQPPRVNTVLVLVPDVHRGSIPAIQFARSIGRDVRAVYIEVDPAKTHRMMSRWNDWGDGIPLVVLESPYRSLAGPLMEYIEEVEAERDDDHIVVVLPEFVPGKLWEKLLHNQTGMMLRAALLAKKNVIVCSVRYFLQPFSGPVSFHAEEMKPVPEHPETPASA